MPNESYCKKIHAILRIKMYSNKFQHCFETSHQRIWTEVPQAGTKQTPDTSDEEREKKSLYVSRRHCHWTLRRVEKVVFDECTMQQFVSRHMSIRRPLGKHFDKKYVVATYNNMSRAMALLVCVSFHPTPL